MRISGGGPFGSSVVGHIAICPGYYENMRFEKEAEENKLGWETGIEPATFGATDRRSTS